MFEVAEEAIRLHKAAFGDDPVLASMLDAGGECGGRLGGADGVTVVQQDHEGMHGRLHHHLRCVRGYKVAVRHAPADGIVP